MSLPNFQRLMATWCIIGLAIGFQMLPISTAAATDSYAPAPVRGSICKTGACCCPDNYCAKPLPPPPCIAGHCPDCYCPKPMPPAPPLSAACCDNYGAKPLICPPKLCEPWYTCGVPRRYCPQSHGAAQPASAIAR